MKEKLRKIFFDPATTRIARSLLVNKLGIGTYEQRVRAGLEANRPHYAFCLYNAASLAKKLGHSEMSVIEFGVAGGKGILALEHHVPKIEKLFSIKIHIYGFDLGEGLPRPADYRDLPFYWKSGFYKMDISALKKRIVRTELVLGDVGKTLPTFLSRDDIPVVGAVMFDLDYYTATKDALQIFHGSSTRVLPRVFCYFDDILGSVDCITSEFTGQRLAIREFNEEHSTKKIDFAYFLERIGYLGSKFSRIRIYHDFEHPNYNTFIGSSDEQLEI